MLRSKMHGTSEFVNREEIILRDHLALERTRLANERTLMSYLRTALYLILGALAFLQLKEFQEIRWIGIVFIPLSFLVVILGFYRYAHLRKQLKEYYGPLENTTPPVEAIPNKKP